jgi:hypothetical protein
MNVVKLINKSSECNINQFLRAAFDDDLSILIISGKPSPKQLQEAFENILTEFNDISGQSPMMDELVLMRQILILEARIKAVEMFLFADEQAAKHPTCPVIEDFSLYHKYGYSIEYHGDKKDFLRQLELIKQAEMSYRVDHQELCSELEALRKKDEKQVRPTTSRVNFLKQIKNIELFYKYQIDFEKYSVERLAILIKDFREMIDHNSMN